MSRKNFYICTDSDGNMPVLSAKPLKPYWVRYVNDHPVEIVLYKGQDQVWDYAESKFLALSPKLTYTGKLMQPYKGVIR